MSDKRFNVLLCVAIAAATALLYLPTIGALHLRHEEPRRAVIARNMLLFGGSWLVPHYADRTYAAKPPMFNWMIAAASAPAGNVSETTARVPSTISLAVLAAFMALTTKTVLSRYARVFLAGSILLAPEMTAKARLAEIEVPFTLLVALATWGWFVLDRAGRGGIRLWLLPGIAAGCAFLTKREPALVFYWLTVAGFLAYRARWKDLFSPAAVAGLALPAAIGAVWIAAIAGAIGIDELWRSTVDEVLTRGSPSSVLDVVEHVALYPVEVWAGMLPFSLFALPLLSRRVRSGLAERYGDAYRFCVWAMLANFPLYWLRGDVSVRYYLPMFPLMLVLCAMVYESYAERTGEISERFATFVGGWSKPLAAVALIAALLVSVSHTLPFWPGAPEPVVRAPFALAMAAAIAFATWRLLAAIDATPRKAVGAAMILGFAALRMAESTVAIPYRVQTLAARENPPAVLARLEADLPEGVTRIHAVAPVHSAFWFYSDPNLLIGETPPVRPQPDRVYMLGEPPEKKLPPELAARWHSIGRYPYKRGHAELGRFAPEGETADPRPEGPADDSPPL